MTRHVRLLVGNGISHDQSVYNCLSTCVTVRSDSPKDLSSHNFSFHELTIDYYTTQHVYNTHKTLFNNHTLH